MIESEIDPLLKRKRGSFFLHIFLLSMKQAVWYDHPCISLFIISHPSISGSRSKNGKQI